MPVGRPRRLALALAGVFLAAAAAATAEITASLDPRIVDEFDTVRLIIRSTGTSQAASLDLDPLENDFEVLTTQSSSQYRSINGQVESWVEYQIILRPRSSGELTVPPIRVGRDSTPPLTLRVRGMAPELREAIERMVFFESELTANPVYVQAETVLVRRLYYASGAQIYSDLPGLPEISNAIVLPLGETSSTATIVDGQRYGVIEQRFAILPEQSGELTIPSISVTSSVRLQTGGRTRRSGVRVATEPLTLTVRPIPPEYPPDHPWLPAEAVEISDRWAPDGRRVEVGDPLHRTLVAQVRGNVSSAIPPLQPALPDSHFRRYPEPPKLEDDTAAGELRGSREQAYAIIPTAPGRIELAGAEIVWWDVAAETVRTTRSAARTLDVTGLPATAPTQPPPLEAESAKPPETPGPAAPEPRARSDATSFRVAAAALVLLLAAAWRWFPRGRAHKAPSERAQRRALQAACRRGDAARLHHALLDYLRRYYRAPLAEALRRFRADGHGDVLDALNAGRYQSGASADTHGERVLAAMRALRRQPRRMPADALPALYD